MILRWVNGRFGMIASAPWWLALFILGTGVCAAVVVYLSGIKSRWEWWTNSANDLGAVAAVAWVMLLTFCSSFAVTFQPKKRILAALFALGILLIVSLAALMGSCSRGGMLGAVVGLLAVALCGMHMRGVAMAGLIALLLCLCLVPKAQSRVTLNPAKDESIAIRTDLLRSSLIMMHDRPLGWGKDAFGPVAERWYLSEYRGITYWHPLSDTLWLGTERGLIVLYIYLAGILALAGGLLRLGANFALPLAIGGGLIVFLTSGATTCLIRPNGVPYVLFGLTVCGLAVLVCHKGWRTCKLWIVLGSGAGILIVGVFAGTGWVLARSWPLRCTVEDGAATCVPRAPGSETKIFVLGSEITDLNALCRQVGRRLVMQGHSVTCMVGDPVVPAMRGEGSRMAIVMRGALVKRIEQVDAVVLIDSPSIPEVPGLHTVPLLLINGSEMPFAAEVSASGKQFLQTVRVQLPRCWPKNFVIYENEICTFLRKRIDAPR